jgi:hypothetical protein
LASVCSGDVDRFTEDGVVLRDGQQLGGFDVILTALGYYRDYSFLPPAQHQGLDLEEDGLWLYRHIIPPRIPVRPESAQFASSCVPLISLAHPRPMGFQIKTERNPWSHQSLWGIHCSSHSLLHGNALNASRSSRPAREAWQGHTIQCLVSCDQACVSDCSAWRSLAERLSPMMAS